MNGPVGRLLRFAIYTRKSSEHNLDLAFTSLDAQREACEAYIKSQAHEGWRLIPDRYEEALLAHLKAKQAGTVPQRRQTFAPPQRVVNLMEALRRSIAEDTKRAVPRKGAAAAGSRKRA